MVESCPNRNMILCTGMYWYLVFLYTGMYWNLKNIGWSPYSKILETTERVTMEFLPDIMLNREARNQKEILT